MASFFEPTSATLLASPGSDLYLTKVVGDGLWVGESSTFVGRQTIPDISTRGTLAITTGVKKTDNDIEFAGFPMSSPDTTTFVLSKTRLMNTGELYGTLTCKQPDGTTSTWTYTSWNLDAAAPRFDISQIRFTSGPGFGGTRTRLAPGGEIKSFEQPQPGYYFPKLINLAENAGDIGQGAATLQIRWNQPLTSASEVGVPEIAYERGTGFGIFNELVNPVQQIDSSLRPSAPARGATFLLPGALDTGSLGIVDGTLSGTIEVDGKALPFTTRRASKELYFDGGPSQTRGVLTTADGSSLSVTGVYDPTGRITLNFDALVRFFPVQQTPARVLVSAEYGVRSTGPDAGDVTFFAGFDITNPIAVDVLTPGSTVHVDSPLTSSSGDIVMNATNIRFNAATKTSDDLRVNAPDVNVANLRKATTTTAQARAEITAGKVERLIPVTGSEGSGYDADNPPIVTIGAPKGVRAEASIGRINGSVVSINLTDRGSGYATAPAITISPPDQPGGVQAVAQADIAAGVITGIRVTTPGSGYSFTPTITIAPPPPPAPNLPQPVAAVAVAVVAGEILSIAVPNGGFGYQTPPAVTITSSTGGAGAVATAAINASGVVTSINIINGGTGYRFDSSTVITIEPPPPSTGETAEARAEVDSLTGRITGYIVTKPGSGYGAPPSVTVAEPLGVIAAKGTATVNLDGTISLTVDPTAPGYGYRTPPRVTITPPTLGTGGRAARATAVLDNEGRVTGFTIVDPGLGYDPAKPPRIFIADPDPIAIAETATFNTNVSANEYRLALADDPNTDPRRGRMFVSPTSSLTNAGAAASVLFVTASQSDVVVEGQVNADAQTIYMESPDFVADLAPFVFTTRAVSGAQTGRITGETVQVILANDAPTPGDDTAVAFNTVDLQTTIDSLRVRAATRAGATRREPFPYALSIAESNDLLVDAVAASSFPIVLAVAGNLLFNATLATAGDIVIDAAADFTLSAPVSTTRGVIKIIGDNVRLNNSLQVTAADRDDARDDIVVESRSGDIILGSTLSAVNRVRLVQRNRTSPQLVVKRYIGAPVPIVDNSTVTASVSVTDNFNFDRIRVGINIAHTFDGDLTGTLVAPNGSRYRLFQRNGGSGDNFTNTIFDSAAPTFISEGSPPYTGSFRPLDSLLPLAGSTVQGTWKLEVRDSGGGDEGTINGFELIFENSSPQEGRIVGTGRIAADALRIEAEGYVGNPDVFPVRSEFFVRTDVATLQATVARSIAIDELNQIDVQSIDAGGLVTLRAEGYDSTAVAAADTPALKAKLFNISNLDVSAPNGSIDVDIFTPEDIVLGNAAALRTKQAFSMLAGGSVRIVSAGGSNGGTLTTLDAPVAASGARTVRGVIDQELPAVYVPGTPGMFASTLTATAAARLADRLPAVRSLRVGDRVLVAGGASGAAGKQANGVYTVTNLGSGTAKWVLTRAPDSDTAEEMPDNAFVRVGDGSTFDTVYRFSYTPTSVAPFARVAIDVVPVDLTTKIGSEDPNELVQYVVSTNGDTNLAAGSLGKTLLLSNVNDPLEGNPRFMFSRDVGQIQLSEELPPIQRSTTAIDGAVRYPEGAPPADSETPKIFIDGSRVTRTYDGRPVTPEVAYRGLQVEADDARIANLVIGGFVGGITTPGSGSAAIKVLAAQNVAIDHVTVGTFPTPSTQKLGSTYGIVVGSGAEDVFITGSVILTSNEAGIRIEGDAQGTVLDYNTIGQSGKNNKYGVEISTTGSSRIRKGNKIERNLWGVRLVAGTTTIGSDSVLPADANQISNNVYAGVLIEGGIATIGTADTLSPGSNQIVTNQGWGILAVEADETKAKQLADRQTIQNNYFVPANAAIGDKTAENQQGTIGYSTRLPSGQPAQPGSSYFGSDGEKWAPQSVDGIDKEGNLHRAVPDRTSPRITLEAPRNADNQPLTPDVAAEADAVRLERDPARVVKAFVIRISDNGAGVDRATVVKDAVTLSRDGIALVEGRDYSFGFANDEIKLVAQAPSYDLGEYSAVISTRPQTGSLAGWMTDLNNNPLEAQKTFLITLADTPAAPDNLTGTSADGGVSLAWAAAASQTPIEYYEIEYATRVGQGSNWRAFVQPNRAATSAKVTGLENGTQHWFRVRGVNNLGAGQWSEVGPIAPLAKPSLQLANDSGTPNDGITSSGTVSVSGLGGGASWQYSTNGGAAWVTGAGSSFVLAEGSYAANTVRVRQSLAGGTSEAGSLMTAVTIDKTAPAAPAVTGLSAGVLSGTAEVGSRVEVFDGDTKLGEATRSGSGWTFATGPLVDGRSYAFRARASDAAGNVGGLSAPLSITIDLTPPPRPTISAVTDDLGSIKGIVPDGGSTDDTVLVLTGTADAGSTVEVFNGATSLGPATLIGTNWTFTTATLTGGTTYAFTATATDAAGNTSTESAVYSVTIDTAAPAPPTITAVTDDVAPFTGPVADGGVTNDTVLVLSGTADAGSTVEVFDGNTKLGNATRSGTGWTFATGPLVDGRTYAFRAMATDAIGNESVRSAALRVTIDATAPEAVRFGSDAVDGTYGPGSAITIVATAPTAVRKESFLLVTLNTGAQVRLEATADGPTLSGTYTVAPGHNTPRLTVTSIDSASVADLAGNTLIDRQIPAGGNLADARAIVVDTVAPVVTGFSSTTPAGTYGIGAVIAITATVNEPVRAGSTLTITLNTGASVTLTAPIQGNVFSGTYTVAAGQNVGSLAVTGINAARVLDRAGNVAGDALPGGNLPPGIAIDSAAPTVLRFESASPDGTYGIGAAINITAVVSETVRAGATMTVALNTGAQVALVAVDAGTTLVGTYVVAVGQSAADLGIQSIVGSTIRDLVGNEAGNTAAGIGTLAENRAIVVDGAVRVVTPVGFSSNPDLVPDRRTAVTSIPITFTTPVTGLTLASFKLFLNLLNGRSVSLRGARLTGSGANYTLTLPRRLTNARGIYTLEISAATVTAAGDGTAMAPNQAIYWGKGRNIGFAAAKPVATRTVFRAPAIGLR